MAGPTDFRAVVERDRDHSDQQRGLGDDKQRGQAARPDMMESRLAPRRDDIGVRVAGRTGHLIIGGGGADDVNQPLGGAG